MLGVLGQFLFGWPFWVGILLGTLFSVVYVYHGGFEAVIRTDLIQFVAMFLGFAVLLVMLVVTQGGWEFLSANLPAKNLTWNGGNAPLYIAVWYVIALATLIEPAFYQRCYAAKTEAVARNGIFVSIACWAVFDFLTTACGLYARALMPDLADPVASYPALALKVLPTGLLGVFALALISTVMSTVDSYSFLAATTFGNDIAPRLTRRAIDITRYSRIGLIVAVVFAVGLAIFFRSVVDIWYIFGSVGTPALLVPVFTSFVGSRKMPPAAAFWSIIISGMVALVWYIGATDSNYWLGLQPIFPGLAVSLVIFGLFSRAERATLAVTE
jgi:SSS family solute:Na+ symporter